MTPLIKVLAALSVLMAMGCNRSSAETHGSTLSPAKIRVRVVKPKKEATSGTRVLPGVLMPWQKAQLGARVAGDLTSILVDRGDRIKRGQVLATIGIPGLRSDVQVAGAQKQTAEAELALLEDERRRTMNVIASAPKGTIAAGEVAALDAKVDAAKARVATAAAEQGRGGSMLADTRIVAPFDGVVLARRADVGTALTAGTVVLEVADVSTLRFAVDVPERDAAAVKVGQAAEVAILGDRDRKVTATIARFAPALDTATRTLRVEIDVPNGDGALLAGVAGRASIDLGSRGEVYTLPAEAVMQDGADAFVFVMDGDIARKRKVKIAYDRGPSFEVAEGLKGDEEIVVGGRGFVRDGTACEVAR
jgi:membrane fusion protein (multidrug efflux system)